MLRRSSWALRLAACLVRRAHSRGRSSEVCLGSAEAYPMCPEPEVCMRDRLLRSGSGSVGDLDFPSVRLTYLRHRTLTPLQAARAFHLVINRIRSWEAP